MTLSSCRRAVLALVLASAFLLRPAAADGAANQNLLLNVDSPVSGAAVSGSIHVSGWAFDSASPDTGIDRVSLSINGAHVKDATLSIERDDVASIYGSGYLGAGWQTVLELDALVAPGFNTLAVTARGSANGAETSVSVPFTMFESRRFGVNAHLMRVGPARAAIELDRATAGEIRLMRFDINWDQLEPMSKGAYDADTLARMDGVFDLMAARGVRPIVVVLRTPAWARNGSGSVMTPPHNPADYADFVGMLANRYAARNLTFEVWNEPNDQHFWDTPSGPDPVAYTQLLKAAYAAIKAASPWSTVLGGSITFNDLRYLSGMYAAGARGSFDGLAIHPYSQAHAPDATSDPYYSFTLALQQFPQVLAENGEPGKPIWITEMGWSTRLVDDAERATYFRRAVELVRERPQIVAFCAYALDQSIDDLPDFGLITTQGAATASWNAYTQAASGR